MKEYWVFFSVDKTKPVDLADCKLIILPSFWRVIFFMISHHRELTYVSCTDGRYV